VAQLRGTTIQQRFGFLDDDLKSSSHDEIMLWAENNLEGIVNALFWKPEWSQGDKEYIADRIKKATKATHEDLKKGISHSQAWDSARERLGLEPLPSYHVYPPKTEFEVNQRARLDALVQQLEAEGILEAERRAANWAQEMELLRVEWPDRPNLGCSRLEWEYAITGAKQFIIGFIDMRAVIMNPLLQIEGLVEVSHTWYNIDDRWRIPVPEKLKINSRGYTEGEVLFIEVKSTLPSAGELLRQIRMYQQYVHGKWLVICPDARHKDILNRQGIHFWQYPVIPTEGVQ